jgi:transposase
MAAIGTNGDRYVSALDEAGLARGNKIKQYRHIAARYDKLAAGYLPRATLASVRIWLRVYGFAP